MENKDYGEIFCQAAEILAQQLINKVSYDRTITCTIVDDREKALGKYRVTNGRIRVFSSESTLRIRWPTAYTQGKGSEK